MTHEFVDIREVWDVVRPGLEKVCIDSQPGWRPEDVYASCVNGQSQLLMDTSRTTEGFLVVESVPIPFSKQSKLLLWVAYDPVPDSAVQYAAEIETLARETGHRQIEILTPHKGLWDLAQQFGYTLKWAVLNKELKE